MSEAGEIVLVNNFLRPVVKPKELIEYHKTMVEFIKEALVEGTDYGTIPGTKTPSLYKPGAERLCKSFNVAPKFFVVAKEKEHNAEVVWKKQKKVWRNAHQGDREFKMVEETGTSLGLYAYTIKCRLVANGRVIAEGLGSCSTMESKYIDRPRDCENTVLKMAKKRAFVDATLTAFGLSNRFTQDMEDLYQPVATASTPAVDIPFEPTPTPSKPALESKIYKDSPHQASALDLVLKGKKVPEEFWGEIKAALKDRPVSDFEKVLAEVSSR